MEEDIPCRFQHIQMCIRDRIYPLELQEQVIAHFAANPQVKVFLFGGGKNEQEVFDAWIAKYPSVVSMIGKLNMRTELNLMRCV